MAAGSYVIRGGRQGRERLAVLTRVLGPTTRALLERVGVPTDAKVLDLGCGGGDVTTMLAAMAPHGHVVGVDADPAVIELARDEAAAAGIGNVEYRVADVSALADDGERYDVVNARFLLSHLSGPEDTLRQMLARCKPGGAVVVEDVDIDGAMCWPDTGAFARASALYCATVRAKGGDPIIGRKLPVVVHQLGARDVHAVIAQPGALQGDAKRIQLLTLANIAEAAVGLDLITRDGVERLTDELTALVESDETFITTARVVQVWGRA